jgi:hypothetical protein
MSSSSSHKSASKLFIFLLACLPIILVAAYIYRFGINLPFWDQWKVVDLLIKKQYGTLSFADLFRQHNQHRPFFPRLLWIALAEFTHYNVNTQLWLNLSLVIGTFIFFIEHSAQIFRRLGRSLPSLLIPFLSLLIFNLGHFESWLQGIQTIMFLQITCVVAGFLLLSESERGLSFILALVLGIVGTFSMATGLLYWPIGFGLLLLASPQKKSALKILAWLIVSILAIGIFFAGWTSANAIHFTYLLSHPIQWANWFLNFLGAPIHGIRQYAWLPGLLSLCIYVALLGDAIRSGQWRVLLPHFAIGLFILLTAGAISIGRMETGMNKSVVSRYFTITVWYWAAMLSLLPLLNFRKIHLMFFYSILTICLLYMNVRGAQLGYRALYQRILPAYTVLEAGQTPDDAVLLKIHRNPVATRLRIIFLYKNKLSLYNTDSR